MGHGQIADFIITECRRGEGRGQLFLRRDGLENTPERVAARQEYLEAHPDTQPEFRRAILAAGVTPGMTKWETIAAWGLNKEELNRVSSRMTASGENSYYSYHGFKIGDVIYTFYVTNDTLTSVSYQGRPDVLPFDDGE